MRSNAFGEMRLEAAHRSASVRSSNAKRGSNGESSVSPPCHDAAATATPHSLKKRPQRAKASASRSRGGGALENVAISSKPYLSFRTRSGVPAR